MIAMRETLRAERFTTEALAGVHLHAIRRGDPTAPALVLLHGGGANAHWWDHIAPVLAQRFHVVALDFRGHGDSDHPDGVEAGAFQRDLEALVSHLGGREVVLVGHSMGGHVALDHAADTGGVRALVAIEVSRGASRRERRRTRLALLARRTYATRDDAVRRFRFLPASPRASEEMRARIASHSVREEADGRYGFKFDARWFGVPPRPPTDLARVRCPVLVVRGAESDLLTAEGARELTGALPDARLVEIREAGHNAHLEQPDAVLGALDAFLAPLA